MRNGQVLAKITMKKQGSHGVHTIEEEMVRMHPSQSLLKREGE
jgi:hypothetical protein